MSAARLDSSLGSLDWLTARTAADETPSTSEQKIRLHRRGGLHTSSRATQEPASTNNVDVSLTFQTDGKPNLSYAELIRRAISSTADKRMTLNEIYKWITDNFPFYKEQEGTSWKNSIRHNLSLNKQFNKVQRERSDPGKGSYWQIDNSTEDNWAKNRRLRGCGCHWEDQRCRSASTCFGHPGRLAPSTPRINPVIKALFAADINSSVPANAYEGPVSGNDKCVVQETLFSPTTAIEPQQAYATDPYASSWGSQVSSLPSNFRFPDLDSSVGSMQSQLSESFRSLYQHALNSSFNSTTTQNPNLNRNQPVPPSTMLTYPHAESYAGNSFTGEPAACLTLPPIATVSTEARVQTHQSTSLSGGYWLKPNLNQTSSTDNIVQSLDMKQFQNMMGSMQGGEIREWLSQCNDGLAVSWRDFLSRSIGNAGPNSDTVPADLWRQWQQSADWTTIDINSATPPAVADMTTAVYEPASVRDRQLFLNTNLSHLDTAEPLSCHSGSSEKDPLLYAAMTDPSSPKNEPNSVLTCNRQDDDSDSDFDWEELINK